MSALNWSAACEWCGDPYDETGCPHGRELCPACLSQCIDCAPEVAADARSERAFERWHDRD